MPELRELLYSNQHKQAHDICSALEADSESSDGLYSQLPLFLEMLDSKNAFVRVRGFRLICAQAKWDSGNLLEKHLDKILGTLEDDKPTNLRQYLSVLPKLISHKPELSGALRNKLTTLDLSKFKDTMRPLILKDIQTILAGMAEA